MKKIKRKKLTERLRSQCLRGIPAADSVFIIQSEVNDVRLGIHDDWSALGRGSLLAHQVELIRGLVPIHVALIL